MKKLVIVDIERCVGCMSCVFACSRRFGDGGVAKSAIWVGSIGGVERGYKVIICRACEDPPCAAVCPTGALRLMKDGGVVLNPNKCIGCKRCVEACPIGAVMWDEETMKPIICTHCGYCADFCPHGVLTVEEVPAKKEVV